MYINYVNTDPDFKSSVKKINVDSSAICTCIHEHTQLCECTCFECAILRLSIQIHNAGVDLPCIKQNECFSMNCNFNNSNVATCNCHECYPIHLNNAADFSLSPFQCTETNYTDPEHSVEALFSNVSDHLSISTPYNSDYLESTTEFNNPVENINDSNAMSEPSIVNGSTRIPPLCCDLNILTLNVCGLRSKVNCPEFVEMLQRYSIVGFQETKLDNTDHIALNNFDVLLKTENH